MPQKNTKLIIVWIALMLFSTLFLCSVFPFRKDVTFIMSYAVFINGYLANQKGNYFFRRAAVLILGTVVGSIYLHYQQIQSSILHCFLVFCAVGAIVLIMDWSVNRKKCMNVKKEKI